MHMSCLVIGPDPEGQLAKYDENLEVPPHIDTCGHCMGEEKYQPCSECNDTGKAMTTRNPLGTWDYWRLGGRWRGALPMKTGSTSGVLGELSYEWTYGPTRDWTGKADQAPAGDVDWDAFFADASPFTFSLVAEGVMREKETWNRETHHFDTHPDWPGFFRSMVERLDHNVLVTVVDYHS